jgi:hypothetical protein
VEVTGSDKHSGLVQYKINYSRKGFMVQATGGFNVRKPVSLVFPLVENITDIGELSLDLKFWRQNMEKRFSEIFEFH